jgi:hypothetical protein
VKSFAVTPFGGYVIDVINPQISCQTVL